MGYRTFSDNTTLEEACDAAEFTGAALEAYPDETVRSLGKLLVPLLDQCDALLAEGWRARRQVVRSNARVRTGDIVADEELHLLVQDLLTVVQGNRDASLFKAFFPIPPSMVIELSLEPELEEIERIQVVLAMPSTPESLRQVWSARLKAVALRGLQALAERRVAIAVLAESTASGSRWIERIDRARRLIHGGLTTYAAEKNLPPDFGDRFFSAPLPGKRRSDQET